MNNIQVSIICYDCWLSSWFVVYYFIHASVEFDYFHALLCLPVSLLLSLAFLYFLFKFFSLSMQCTPVLSYPSSFYHSSWYFIVHLFLPHATHIPLEESGFLLRSRFPLPWISPHHSRRLPLPSGQSLTKDASDECPRCSFLKCQHSPLSQSVSASMA